MLHLNLLNYIKAFLSNPSNQVIISNLILIFHEKITLLIDNVFSKSIRKYEEYTKSISTG